MSWRATNDEKQKFLDSAFTASGRNCVRRFSGEATKSISLLSWLNFGQSFGLDTPLVLNLGVLVITFGLTIRITMASIIGVAIALLIYRYL